MDNLHHVNVNQFVSSGPLRSIRTESALPEGLRAEAELQRSRCDQMGALHRPQRHLRDPLLTEAPPHGETQPNRWRDYQRTSRMKLFIVSLSPPLSQLCVRWSIHTKHQQRETKQKQSSPAELNTRRKSLSAMRL